MMNSNDFALSFNEEVVFKLRSLFNKNGYSQYKMSKFEEYDLYSRNKDFLISDSIITFTDTNGKLMALKPDVTLSIIKNSADKPNTLQKVYYNENVYRVTKGTNTYKEIMQVGLECLGDIDKYSISEVLALACKSISTISDSCVLDISNLAIVTAVCESFALPSYVVKDVLKYIGEKNIHELTALCNEHNLSQQCVEILKSFIFACGKPQDVLPKLKSVLKGIIDEKIIDDFQDIIDSLDDDAKNIIRLDFSVVSDTHFYNAIVFKGFINGVPVSVLSGGQYDKLLQKMKRKSKAIGFAVYLDAIERLVKTKNEYDVDTVVIYDDDCNLTLVRSTVNNLTDNGLTVFACKQIPSDLKYRNIVNLTQ